MLLEGAISSDKTLRLAEKYAQLINSGVESSEILVILQNAQKNLFVEKVLENINSNSLEKLQIHSFFGLVYNTISDNWAFIENMIKDGKTSILPNLVGMEVSQFILRDIIKDVKFKGYNSKKSLLHQLFRRYSLIVQNNLSDDDVKWRSSVLKEDFAEDAKKALDEFKSRTLHLRGFDYLRQGLIFNYIYKNTKYFSSIKYLFVDDGDEMIPLCFDFIKHLKPQLKEAFIAYDNPGASRIGYLSADKSAVTRFEDVFGEQPEVLEIKSGLKQDAEVVFTNVLEQKYDKLSNFTLTSVSKRAQMMDLAVEKVKSLINSGIKPSDISLITPVMDDMLKFCLRENLKSSWANLVFISGSEKMVQNQFVLAALTILKLCDKDLIEEVGEFETRAVLTNFLYIPLRYCKEILKNFEESRSFIEYNFGFEEYDEKYKKFKDLILELSSSDLKLSRQVFEIFDKLADFKGYKVSEINRFNFFIKQLEDFENVFDKEGNFNEKKARIINQIENSIIADNPYSSLDVGEEDLIVSTPQKIIDNQILTKYQIWLDVSSDEWIKSDTGPLYNAWVFQASWEKDEFSLQDNIELGRQKTARILRKLMLCAGSKIYGYASLFDGSGVENFGGIEKYLNFDPEVLPKSVQKPIIPRADQKPVLDYKSGSMAISAVPGAGKTTILLALILKILEKGANPENIFVLTYMESAARNFRERIQNANQGAAQLPNISTIHGLALKILKENANFEKLGLNADFEICDDTQRSRILREISQKLKIKKTEQEDFDRAISVLKMGGGTFSSELQDKKAQKFVEFFNEYDSMLKSNNLIDYDDMLIFSVKLLEENQDVLDYYQELCHYIIEDEAQDSSAIQQRLIGLLSAKHKNLIRCGDINQAITTTFSNADVEGFRKFIEISDSTVSMDCSQRCTKDVWTLANNLVKFAKNLPNSKKAFYEIYMKPVDDKNPQEKNAIVPILFENDFAEKNFVLKQIKTAIVKNPKATIGILLRNNYQVAKWTKFINDAGLKSITRSECLEQKAVFRTIFAILKIILEPFNNENLADNYSVLAELGHYNSNFYAAIKNHPTPFIQMNADDIENVDLAQFYWDIIHWLSFCSMPVEEIAIKIGLYYYQSEVEKSNVYLISTLIKRLSVSYPKYSTLIERLAELSKKPSLSGFKFFSEEDESKREFLSGKVQIMTLHKSKGDEFDFVFLPEMIEKNLTLDFAALSLKSNSRFMETIRELNSNYKTKSDDELKEFLLEENFRLLYVAITRAKRKLYVTAAKTAKPYGKLVNQEPGIIFDSLLKTQKAVECE